PGVLGEPGPRILMGGGSLDNEVRQGARVRFGSWLDHRHDFALEGSYFFLNDRTIHRSVGSTGEPGSPTLAIPFFDVTGAGDTSTFLADPGRFSGLATLAIHSRLQGAEVNLFYDIASSF